MILYVTVTLLIITYRCSSLWTQGTTRLPKAEEETAIGYNMIADTILIFGGLDFPQQFVTFKDHQFTNVDTYYLSAAQQTHGAGQYYTQLDNDLWIIRDDGSGFTKINTETYAITDPSINIPTSTSYGACLASISGFLIVLGGGGWSSAINNVQIYNIAASQWLSDVPSLPNERMSAACVVVNNKVYVIGGWDGDTTEFDSIQVLDVSKLPNTSELSWTLFGTLASGRTGPRAVVHGTDIYVIGGDTGSSRAVDVNVIDTINGSCEVLDTLVFGTSYASSIAVNNVLYTFGGFSESGLTDKYQYTMLPVITVHRMDISVIILIVSLSVVLLSIVLVPIYRCFKKTQLGLKLAEDIDIQQNSQQKDNINNNNNNNESETKEDKLFIVNNLETQGMTPMELHKKANKDAFEVQDWLENIVQLPQYFEMLMNSGYEAMSFIKEIPNIIELFEIGIESKEHQTKLWEEIQKLKGEKQQNDKLNQLIVAAEQTFESGENTKREGSIAIL